MKVEDRFLKYITFDTQSDEESETCPSTPGQLVLGKALAEELLEIGATDVVHDSFGYVYGTIPATKGHEKQPVMAWIAHMDTSPAASGKDVKAVITHEDGEDIIRSDGTTLLGADDKAGVAEIMAAAEKLLKGPEEYPHPEIRVVFTPDEEIGRGMDHIDLDMLKADYAYTVDGGEVGELSYECFNAAAAKVTVRGASFHPGDSYHKMKNAILMAQEFISMLPANETPAETRGREGFYHLDGIRGDVECCELFYILRDHDKAILESRKQTMEQIAGELNRKHAGDTPAFEVEITDSYENMIEKILPDHARLLDAVREVYAELGIKSVEDPIRGGTDGARLSFLGVPCPNLGTGGHDFHGRREHISIQSMQKAVEVLIRLAEKMA